MRLCAGATSLEERLYPHEKLRPHLDIHLHAHNFRIFAVLAPSGFNRKRSTLEKDLSADPRAVWTAFLVARSASRFLLKPLGFTPNHFKNSTDSSRNLTVSRILRARLSPANFFAR